MKKLSKFLIILPIILLTGCSITKSSSKAGPNSLKEQSKIDIRFGTSHSDG